MLNKMSNNNLIQLLTKKEMLKLLLMLCDKQVCDSVAWENIANNKSPIDWYYGLNNSELVAIAHNKLLIYQLMKKGSLIHKKIGKNIKEYFKQSNFMPYERLVTNIARLFFDTSFEEFIELLSESFVKRGIDIEKNVTILNPDIILNEEVA